MEALAVKDLQRAQAEQVVVGLSERGVVLGGGQIAEGRISKQVDREREEDLVVHEHLLTSGLIRVQRC